MKTRIISTLSNGYGHITITIQHANGKTYNATTNNMPLYDAYKSDTVTLKQERDQRRAEKDLIRFVKDQNRLK